MRDCRWAATEESGSRRRLSTVGGGTQRSCVHADSRDAAEAGWEPRDSRVVAMPPVPTTAQRAQALVMGGHPGGRGPRDPDA